MPEVLAPVLSTGGVVAIINRHPYRFRLKTISMGWLIIKPLSSSRAQTEREAYPYEIGEYLKKLPRLHCIACRRLGPMSWLVYPFNLGDAKQRLGSLEFPRSAYLVTENIEPFQIIACRIMGNSLLYDRLASVQVGWHQFQEQLGAEATGVKFPSPEFGHVYNILLEDIREQKKQTTEGRIKDAISYLGAELVSFSERGEDYTVRWKDKGHEHQVTVSRDFRLLTAGICLDGLEREQSLSSVVAVMRQYEEDDYD